MEKLKHSSKAGEVVKRGIAETYKFFIINAKQL